MQDNITLTLTDLSDEMADKLSKLDLGEDNNKKIKIRQLLKIKQGLQDDLSRINAELDELRK